MSDKDGRTLAAVPWELVLGDCLPVLRARPAGYAQAIVTSPPYWQQRDFGIGPDDLGLESQLERYVERMVMIGAELRRVLADDGVLWLNLGDSYVGRPSNGRGHMRAAYFRQAGNRSGNKRVEGLPDKSLVGVPWRVALALQADGWLLRCDIVWEKPNAQPQYVLDRPSTSHEYVFQLTKCPKYFYDREAALEPSTQDPSADRNLRSVWKIPVSSRRDGHHAPFPAELPRRCIAASTRPGDLVLDPFAGRGTTGEQALRLGRRFLGIDASQSSVALAECNLLRVREEMRTLTAGEAEQLSVYQEQSQLGLLVGEGELE